uniref:DUF834 domain-containing protein n=1 Tax=Oryza sativa subsp. japonica TaxID=39947 RepID=Q69MG5_ORYSJ|nr:hypothetical protein [Oryza sativa Japonica Group]BAD36328.1 hypothetical protein [Oryza sativa Japonica Group]
MKVRPAWVLHPSNREKGEEARRCSSGGEALTPATARGGSVRRLQRWSSTRSRRQWRGAREDGAGFVLSLVGDGGAYTWWPRYGWAAAVDEHGTATVAARLGGDGKAAATAHKTVGDGGANHNDGGDCACVRHARP